MDTKHSAAAAIGLIEALNTKSGSKGVKGVVKDTDGKVNPTLTPAEKTRYQNIFKIAKSIMDPEPESGSIDPTVQPTQTPEIQKVPMVEQVATEKKDEGILGMLTGLLPFLPVIIPLIIPLLGAAVTGLALLFKDEIIDLIKGWWNEKMSEVKVEFLGEAINPLKDAMNQLVASQRKFNDSQMEIRRLVEQGEARAEVANLKSTIQDPSSTPAEIEIAANRLDDLERAEREKQGQTEAYIQGLLAQLVQTEEALSIAEFRNNQSTIDPYSGVGILTPDWLKNFGPKYNFDNKITSLNTQLDSLRKQILDELLAQEYGPLDELRKIEEEGGEDLIEKYKETIDKILKDRIIEYKDQSWPGTAVEDGIIFQNGRSTRIDSSDSIIAAKPGGPIEKMLDQNSAIQTEQLGVLKEIRDGIKELLKRDVPILRNNDNGTTTTLSFVPNRLLTEFFA